MQLPGPPAPTHPLSRGPFTLVRGAKNVSASTNVAEGTIRGEQRRPTSKVAASPPGPADEESQDVNGFSTFTEPYRWPSERSSE